MRAPTPMVGCGTPAAGVFILKPTNRPRPARRGRGRCAYAGAEAQPAPRGVRPAVGEFVHDGDYLAMGGFGHIRVAMAVVYEIIRQRRQHLVLAGKTAVHDADLLIGSGCVDRIEVAYAFAQELRGLSPASRRAVESGACRVVGEISNAGYQWRFLAGMLGVPFLP